MNADIIEKLKGFDTPTICNAIEVAEGKRGFSNFTNSTMIETEPVETPIVGRALTAAIRAKVAAL